MYGVATWAFGSQKGQACGRVATARATEHAVCMTKHAVRMTAHLMRATEHAVCTHYAHDRPCDIIQCCVLFRVTVRTFFFNLLYLGLILCYLCLIIFLCVNS